MNATAPRSSRWVASTGCVGPWGSTAGELRSWLSAGPAGAREVRRPPPVPGFIESQFNPLVYAVVKQCLGSWSPEEGAGTAIVLGSGLGDTTTADVASQNVAKGNVHNPLLFYQSVPTSILGYVTREFGITGPLSCVAGGELGPSMLEMADLLLEDESLHQVLLLGLELQLNPRTARVRELQGQEGGGLEGDVAVGLLLRRAPAPHGGAKLEALQEATAVAGLPAFPRNWSALRDLITLCLAYEHS
ncbi:MAG: hypothetical protein ACJ8AT_09540 [Hyalangium sp.]|uniref:hypothetical protein n=1 Tax=Hyalangium sp. TaxID=2028555 RepID=UPI00389AF29B